MKRLLTNKRRRALLDLIDRAICLLGWHITADTEMHREEAGLPVMTFLGVTCPKCGKIFKVYFQEKGKDLPLQSAQ